MDRLAGKDFTVCTTGTETERGCCSVKNRAFDTALFCNLQHSLRLTGDTTLNKHFFPAGDGRVSRVEGKDDCRIYITVLQRIDVLLRIEPLIEL